MGWDEKYGLLRSQVRFARSKMIRANGITIAMG
jgi:hypothetical protein